jgi:hypothetical protein
MKEYEEVKELEVFWVWWQQTHAHSPQEKIMHFLVFEYFFEFYFSSRSTVRGFHFSFFSFFSLFPRRVVVEGSARTRG